jgi:protein subunit release factor B
MVLPDGEYHITDLTSVAERTPKRDPLENQILTYMMAPTKQVEDHRSGYKTTDAPGVLEGNLDELVRAYLGASLSKRD